MTPDLRFTVRNAGPLDLRLRIARNGDTCVDNRGPGAPTLAVSDPFGEAMYEVGPGQHVLFEHGSLREVVDHESSPCGCPDEKGMSIADALLAPGAGAAAPAKVPAAPASAPADVQAAERRGPCRRAGRRAASVSGCRQRRAGSRAGSPPGPGGRGACPGQRYAELHRAGQR